MAEKNMNESTAFKRILFCTDFSTNADHAFRFALKAALHNNGVLYILHVNPEPDAQFWKGYVYRDNEIPEDEIRATVEAKVAETYLPMLEGKVNYKIVCRMGNAAERILEFATEEKIDLCVVGRQGAGAVRSFLFGNVATKVTRNIRCPILVIPPLSE